MLSHCSECRFYSPNAQELHCSVNAYYPPVWSKAKDWTAEEQSLVSSCSDFSLHPFQQKAALTLELTIQEWIDLAEGSRDLRAVVSNQLSSSVSNQLREQFPELNIEVNDVIPF